MMMVMEDPIPVRPEGVPADSILRVLRVPPECEGMRLDRFLPSQLRATSRTRAQLIISGSAYSVDGRKLRPSDRVRAEQRIYLWRPAIDESADALPLPVLFEDEHIVVINKPAQMTVHPTARHHHQTVLKRLMATYPGSFVSLIHRLDRDTSGVLLAAKTASADRAFKMALEARSMEAARAQEPDLSTGEADKTYYCITHGVPRDRLVDEPLEEDPSPLKVKMRIAERGRGLPARTQVQVMAELPGYALVRCELYTGRQHQIRVHLAFLGTPVVGDKLYGEDERLLARSADGCLTEEDRTRLELPRHALHAGRYRLEHALTGEELDLRAPFPEDLVEFWLERGGTLADIGSLALGDPR